MNITKRNQHASGIVRGIFTKARRAIGLAVGTLATLCLSATGAQYTVTGSGYIQSSPGPGHGVVGESVIFSFTYDDATFTRTLDGGNYANYAPATPIQVELTGSESGRIAVDPITIANAYNDPGGNFDQWNFFSGLNGLTQANSPSSQGFTVDPGADFATVNQAFVSTLPTLWAVSGNVGFGKDSVSSGATVGIGNASWTIVPAGQVQPVATIINDQFDDGNTGTNTVGVGHGFTSLGQSSSSEGGGFLNLDNPASYNTRVYVSDGSDAVNPFQASPTTLTYTFGQVNRGAEHHRLWVGYRMTNSGDNHFFPNNNTQGLYLSVISQNSGEDGYPQLGNLVAVSYTGERTILASWNWTNPDALSGLTVKLTTNATQYQLEFSGATGGIPIFVTGTSQGRLTGLGQIYRNFDCGIHNQYWFDNGGGVKLDAILLQSNTTFNGQALAFDGVDDYVASTNPAGLPTGNSDHTVEFWVNYAGGQSGHRWLLWHGTPGVGERMEAYGVDGDTGRLRVHRYSPNDTLTNVELPANKWTHLSFVYHGASRTTEVYKNGELAQTLTFSNDLNLTGNNLQLGTFDSDSAFSAHASMDEVRIWNYARSIAQIQAASTNELAGDESGLGVYYNFNHGLSNSANPTATNLADATAAGNNATLHNFALTGASSNWTSPGAPLGRPLPVPEISIDNNGTEIPNGGIWNFDATLVGTTNQRVIFAKNVGAGPLNIASATIDGDAAADFTIVSSPVAGTLEAGAILGYFVNFTPSGPGARSAVFHITSDDNDEAQTDIVLHGIGWTTPVVNLLGNPTIEVASNSVYVDAGATGSSFGDGALPVTVSGTVNTAAVGSYTIRFTATDSLGYRSTATRTVNVVDVTDPTLTLTGGDYLTVTVGSGAWTEPGFWAEDETTLKKNPAAGTTTTIGGGSNFGAAIRNDGTLAVWGQNGGGVLSASLNDVKTISTSDSNVFALTVNGETGTFGSTGWSDVSGSNHLTGIAAVASSYYTNFAVDLNGGVVGYGGSWNGIEYIPPGVENVRAISSGYEHVVALKSDGTLVAWGSNSNGKTDIPAGLSGVISIAVSDNHNLALLEDGTVVAWGDNGSGQTDVPSGLSDVVAIACSYATSLALKSDGTVVAWGSDSFGLVSDAATKTNIASIGAGPNTFYGVKNDGTVVAWGKTDAGEADFPPGLLAKIGGNAPATEPINVNLTAQVVVSGTVDTNTPGNYILTYTVTDYSGNVTTKTRTVTVSGGSSGLPALDDAVTTTTGGTVLYPLANDGTPSATIVSVSDNRVQIDGRALIVPSGFTGSFTYTTNLGDSATVTVSAGAIVSNPTVWSGLLYNSTGAIVGRTRMARSKSQVNTLLLFVGGTRSTVVGSFTGNSASLTSPTLGAVNLTSGANGLIDVALPGGVSGQMRPARLSTVATRYNVALGCLDSTVTGAGYFTVRIKSTSAATVVGRLPDSTSFSAASELNDNGTLSFYCKRYSGAAGKVGGELVVADLTKTDITGELEWLKSVKVGGIDQTPLSTVLVANGSSFTGFTGIPDGPVVITYQGRNTSPAVSFNATLASGKVGLVDGRLARWLPTATKSNFTALFVDPVFHRPISASGIYLPKSRTAIGRLAGSELNSRVEMRIP